MKKKFRGLKIVRGVPNSSYSPKTDMEQCMNTYTEQVEANRFIIGLINEGKSLFKNTLIKLKTIYWAENNTCYEEYKGAY